MSCRSCMLRPKLTIGARVAIPHPHRFVQKLKHAAVDRWVVWSTWHVPGTLAQFSHNNRVTHCHHKWQGLRVARCLKPAARVRNQLQVFETSCSCD
jgi:hypothetical protein